MTIFFTRLGLLTALFLILVLLNGALMSGVQLSAISVSVLTDWLGNDGNWSP